MALLSFISQETLMASTLPAQIKAEWNIVRAWVATHQLAAGIMALAVAWMVGRYIPWP